MSPGGLKKRKGKSRWPGHYDENYSHLFFSWEALGVVLPELLLEWLVSRPGAAIVWCVKAGRVAFRLQLRNTGQNALAGIAAWVVLSACAVWVLS